MDAIEAELISKHCAQIIEKDSGIKFMIENNCLDDLLLLYRCLNRNETNLVFIMRAMGEYIDVNGTKIVRD